MTLARALRLTPIYADNFRADLAGLRLNRMAMAFFIDGVRTERGAPDLLASFNSPRFPHLLMTASMYRRL